MEYDGDVYVYDFSELRTEVEEIQTQISEMASAQSEQASEIVSYMSETADYAKSIEHQTEIELILLFAVICFIGMVCGLLGALTWRTNK